MNSKKQCFNPYLPSFEYVPDGEPRVFGDRLYIYGSHDAFDGDDFCVKDYVCWSAPLDCLGDWRYEGVIYKATQDPRTKEGNMHMCAPDCVQGQDGRYYLYYQLHALSITSVAASDSPIGPFEFYGYLQHPDGTPWGEKKGDVFAFDPGVLVDGKRTFIYVGFAPTGFMKTIFKLRGNRVDASVCLELSDDMKTVIGGEKTIVPGPELSAGTSFEEHAFVEASSIRKMGEKYVYVYSSEKSHELCYAISRFPDRNFEYGGILVSIGDIGFKGNDRAVNYTGNTHGGMVEINDQWYIFYHRQTNKQKCARQGCAEKLHIREDGSFEQAEVTSCGLNAGPLSGKGVYEARIACNLWSKEGTFSYVKTREKDKKGKHPYYTQSGGDREENGDQYIANMKDGSVAGFKYFDIGPDTRISMKVRGDAKGRMRISNSPASKDYVEINISPSHDYTEMICDKTLPFTGEQALFFTFIGKGSVDFKSFALE